MEAEGREVRQGTWKGEKRGRIRNQAEAGKQYNIINVKNRRKIKERNTAEHGLSAGPFARLDEVGELLAIFRGNQFVGGRKARAPVGDKLGAGGFEAQSFKDCWVDIWEHGCSLEETQGRGGGATG
jgi:hypothetical protein